MKRAMLLAVLLCGCQTAAPLQHWGTMREALRDGAVEARVDAAEVATKDWYGVGAAAKLDGEITVVDGTVHVTRVRDGKPETQIADRADATILVLAKVTDWRRIRVEEDIGANAIEEFLARQAATADLASPFPFMIVGGLRDLHVHVIAGQCPVRARRSGTKLESHPFEQHFDSSAGRLVGIYAADAGGIFTHHGTKTHVHAIVEDKRPFTGHVDSFALTAGAELWLPASK